MCSPKRFLSLPLYSNLAPDLLSYIDLQHSELESSMHPLPPPPQRETGNQAAPTRPTVAPIQEPSTGADRNSKSAFPPPATETKKKRNHRGKKSKRNRRQSFAAPSEADSMPSAVPEVMPEQNGRERSNSGMRQSYHGLGRSGGNLSSTSLDSETLFDHR